MLDPFNDNFQYKKRRIEFIAVWNYD